MKGLQLTARLVPFVFSVVAVFAALYLLGYVIICAGFMRVVSIAMMSTLVGVEKDFQAQRRLAPTEAGNEL